MELDYKYGLHRVNVNLHWLAVRCCDKDAENPLPMTVAHTSEIRRVGGAETNWHLLDLTWYGKKPGFPCSMVSATARV